MVNGLPAGGGEPSAQGAQHERGGHGLRGMAERVALYGGQLQTEADAKRFRVAARFPIRETVR